MAALVCLGLGFKPRENLKTIGGIAPLMADVARLLRGEICQLAFQGVTAPTVKEREWTADALGYIKINVLFK